MGCRIWRRRGNAAEGNGRPGPAADRGRGLEMSNRVFGLWHRLIGCPNARFRQGFPVAGVWTEELGRELRGVCAHGGHEVSVIMGSDKQAQAAAESAFMRISRPVMQTGHRRNCCSEVESLLPGESVLAWLTTGGASRKDRHSASFCFFWRLARKPKWRM